MNRTFIAAILIAITANSASAQQTISATYQVGQSWSAPAYQPQVHYQQYPVQQSLPQSMNYSVQPAPYAIQGQYYLGPQPVYPQAAPAENPQVLSAAVGEPTSVLEPVTNQPNQQLQVAAPKGAPAPAPSIPPQPEDLMAPVQQVESSVLKTLGPQEERTVTDQLVVSSKAPAPAPSIPPQPEDAIGPETSILVAQPEPVEPAEENVMEPLETQQELVATEDAVAVEETIAPAETAVVESPIEVGSVMEGQSVDLTAELATASETNVEPTNVEAEASDVVEASDIEDSIDPVMDMDVADSQPVEESVEEVTEPVELAVTETESAEIEVTEEVEIEVAQEPVIESTEPSLLDSTFESGSAETVAIAAATSEIAQETAAEVSPQGDTEDAVAATAPTQFRRSANYGSWLLALLPTLAIPVIGWLALRKRRQNAEVNHFANEALSRINSKPSRSSTAKSESDFPGNSVGKSFIEMAKESFTGSSSTVQSRLDTMVKGVLTDADKKTVSGSETTGAIPVGKEVDTVVDDFSNHDQFCCIRGIDANTQQALHKAGYVRFNDLAKATQSELELALSSNGHEFSSADFSRWSSLAALAGQGDWAGFETLQASFTAPKVQVVQPEPAIVIPKVLAAPSIQADPVVPAVAADDLTKVRGIGPATAELLNRAGITTFGALAESGTARLQEILDAGGAKFDAIDPSLWCRQAQFQLSGTWTRPHVETIVFDADSDANTVAVAPNVTVTTPKYRVAEPTLEISIEDGQAPASAAADSLAKMAGLLGSFSKEEVERLEQSAGTSSELNDESALLEQINSIREIAANPTDNQVSDETFSAADVNQSPVE